MVGKIATPKIERAVKVFACTECGAPVEIRAEGMSLVCVCSSCHTIMDAMDEMHQIISKAATKNLRTQYIQIGTRGKLKGVLWEVIGYMEKTDSSFSYQWSEYLLFNPARGFRWITENDGHWNWVIPIKNTLPDLKNGYYGGHKYELFHQGKSKVCNVLGEFYWRVAVNDKAEVSDFVRDNEILSFEKTESEVSWSIGEYLEPDVVKKAFNLDKLPSPKGVAPSQPNTVSPKIAPVLKQWVYFVGIILFIQLLTVIMSDKTLVSSNKYAYQNSYPAATKDITTPVFKLKDETVNIDISLSGEISNSWLYIAGSLINVDTGEAIEFDDGVEYYTGSDSDGVWTEGSKVSHKILPAIPGGNYQLNFEVSGEKDAPFKVKVIRDVVVWGNMFWAFGLLSMVPIFMFWRKRRFELARWSQSDYSPYAEHHNQYED